MVAASLLRKSNRAKSRAIVIGLMTAGLVATGCSSSKKTTSSSSTTAASSASSILGTPKPATGTPVKIGFITEGKEQAVDNSSEVPAAQAAAKYANAYLGGIGGHPIELDVCDDKQTPSGTTDCDNQMITDKVPIVLNNVTGNGDPLIKNIAAAGIPAVLYGPPGHGAHADIEWVSIDGTRTCADVLSQLAADFCAGAAL